MPKKPLVRTLMGSGHVKGSEKFLKSARQYFCDTFCSLRNEISSKNSVLVVSEILTLFVNILTPDERIVLNKNYFQQFFLHFRNLPTIWNTFNKKIRVTAVFFPKLKTSKSRVS